MPDQSEAATEHALIQEITGPLESIPDDPVPIAADADFPVVLRGYDRLAVDAYVKKTSQLVAELQATRSPEAAVRRALERVGEQISGILQRAHDTAEQITAQSRRESEDRLELARQEAHKITGAAEERLKDLDAETDRIWAERQRIVEDARDLARQLLSLAEEAAARFPPAEEPDAVSPEDTSGPERVSDPPEEHQPQDAAPTVVPAPPEPAGETGGGEAAGPSSEETREEDDNDATAVMPPFDHSPAEPPPLEFGDPDRPA